MKIWAKTVTEEKILKDTLYDADVICDEQQFVESLQEICEIMDIPTPVVTHVNYEHFSLFNNTRFKPRDFVESVDFEMLDVEAIPDKKE